MDKNIYSVLVVEDEKQLLELIVAKFKDSGFSIMMAKDGEEGLDVALKQKPDVILLDILMPKKNGIEMLKELRKDTWGKDAVVFLLTNVEDIEMISEGVQNDITGYFIKSNWKLEDVVQKVQDTLE